MKVSVDITQQAVEGDYGYIDGLSLTCERYNHCVEVFGTSDRSARAGAQKLRDDCPNDESNFYDVDWWT